MWNSLSLPWQAAVSEAWQASLAGSLPIGAVIVGPDQAVAAKGRNRLHEPRQVTAGWLSGVRIGHAEINALLALDGLTVNPKECTLYTTTEPCPMCAGATVMANVRAVCFGSRDPWAGSSELFHSSRYMRSKNVHVEGPADRADGSIFEAVLIAMQVEAFLRLDSSRERSAVGPLVMLNAVIDSMAEVNSTAVALGRELFQNGDVLRMHQQDFTAGDVLDTIAARL